MIIWESLVLTEANDCSELRSILRCTVFLSATLSRSVFAGHASSLRLQLWKYAFWPRILVITCFVLRSYNFNWMNKMFQGRSVLPFWGLCSTGKQIILSNSQRFVSTIYNIRNWGKIQLGASLLGGTRVHRGFWDTQKSHITRGTSISTFLGLSQSLRWRVKKEGSVENCTK